jgi:hypothetical protein
MNTNELKRKATFLAQRETEEREQVTQKYVTEQDLGVFWTT